MPDDRAGELMLEAFLLGIRVTFRAYGLDPATSDGNRWLDLLREVAEGETTLIHSPSEAGLRRAEDGAYLSREAGGIIAGDRATARRLSEALARLTGR